MTAPATTPCINICQIERESGLCIGCLRSIAEITAWSRMDEASRAQVMGELPGRRLRRPEQIARSR